MEDKILFNVNEVCKILGVGKARVYALIENGYLPALNIGGLKVRKTTIDRFLEQYEGYDFTDLRNIRQLIATNATKVAN